MLGGMRYQVRSSSDAVVAWSAERLRFEPRDWQVAYRDELRDALRQLAGDTPRGLLAEYDAPEAAFVDVENVLLYNVGMAYFAPLIAGGLTCRRAASVDANHHVRYRLVDEAPDPGGGQLFGILRAELGPRMPTTTGAWWARLRPHAMVPTAPTVEAGEFTIDVMLSGPQVHGTRVANLVKSLLDGVVSCFHAHDGSHSEELRLRLAALGPGHDMWRWLTDPSTAMLGARTLVRPYRQNVYWNPADERCQAFRIRHRQAATWSVHAQLRWVP